MTCLANPYEIYKNENLALKGIALNLAFTGPITYTKETGVRTAQTSVIFRFLENIRGKCEMVPPHGN